jgi:hypothetical protein
MGCKAALAWVGRWLGHGLLALAIYLYIGYGQKVGLAIWHGFCYIWFVGMVVALSYIGMVIGVIGRYV